MILKGRIFHFVDVGRKENPENSFEYFEMGGLVVSGEKIVDIGDFNKIIAKYSDHDVIDHKNNLIFPGFIDLHNHFPQVQVIGSYGTQLLEWLNKYTFPEEAKFISKDYSKQQAKKFIKLLINCSLVTLRLLSVFGLIFFNGAIVFMYSLPISSRIVDISLSFCSMSPIFLLIPLI